MTPTTLPPPASTASAMTPIRPTFPPPYTRSMPRRASSVPRFFAASAYAGFAPWLEPQKTQRRLNVRGRAVIYPNQIQLLPVGDPLQIFAPLFPNWLASVGSAAFHQ